MMDWKSKKKGGFDGNDRPLRIISSAHVPPEDRINEAQPPPPTLTDQLTFTGVRANVLAPKIIIQYTFVTVDIAQRRRSESLDMPLPDGKTAPEIFL